MDISVVIAVLNAAEIIPRQFEALERQDFAGSWEVLICDNGSTDDLATVVDAWRPRLPNLQLIDASLVGGAGFARDVGVRAARADRIATCDADDIVAPTWLSAIYGALDHHAIVTGPLARVRFDEVDRCGVDAVFEHAEFTLAPGTRHGVPYAGGNNGGYRKAALRQGFAWDYLVGEDGATSWRAKLQGFDVGWAPAAKVLFRARPSGRPSFRRLVSVGVAGVRQDREFGGRVLPASARFPYRGFGWLIVHLPDTRSREGRTRWLFKLATALGGSVEMVFPGLWWGLLRRRREKGRRSDHVASMRTGRS